MTAQGTTSALTLLLGWLVVVIGICIVCCVVMSVLVSIVTVLKATLLWCTAISRATARRRRTAVHIRVMVMSRSGRPILRTICYAFIQRSSYFCRSCPCVDIIQQRDNGNNSRCTIHTVEDTSSQDQVMAFLQLILFGCILPICAQLGCCFLILSCLRQRS